MSLFRLFNIYLTMTHHILIKSLPLACHLCSAVVSISSVLRTDLCYKVTVSVCAHVHIGSYDDSGLKWESSTLLRCQNVRLVDLTIYSVPLGWMTAIRFEYKSLCLTAQFCQICPVW